METKRLRAGTSLKVETPLGVVIVEAGKRDGEGREVDRVDVTPNPLDSAAHGRVMVANLIDPRHSVRLHRLDHPVADLALMPGAVPQLVREERVDLVRRVLTALASTDHDGNHVTESMIADVAARVW